MKVKEESEKAGLKLNIQKTKIMASGPITSWQIDGKKMETDAVILVFFNVEFKSTVSLTFFKVRLFSSSSLSAIRVVSSAYLRSLIFLPAILILAYDLSSPTFHMMYSAYKLNKQAIYRFDKLLFLFGTSLLFHVQF